MANPDKVPSDQYLRFAADFAQAHPDVADGSMFGMRCLKRGNKAFAGGFGGGLVVKLDADASAQLLALDGTHEFDPSGSERPMKAWVVLGVELQDRWEELAEAAYSSTPSA